MDKRLTMLVIDDMEINRASLNEIFHQEYDVFEASDGMEAMKIMEKQKIDIVILDLFMPRMNGFEVIEAMKKNVQLSDIPIVVKTAIDEKTEVKALQMGADDFIFSPCDPEIIKNRVRNIVEKYILEKEKIRAQLLAEQQMNRAKEAFLARMSHELRTPISGILGITQLSHYYKSDEKKTENAFKRIGSQAEYLLSLVNDVLDMAAIDNEKLTLHTTVFPLNSIVSAISDLYYSQCRQKGIQFNFEVCDVTHEFLIGDPVRLKQIIINLLSNAFKFTEEEGSVDVLMKESEIDDHRVLLEIKVSDSGCGISEKTLTKIWEPFEQEEHENGKNYGGSGLGLPITKSIVDLMGGNIQVASCKGEGTTFEVKIPFEIGIETVAVQKKFKSLKAFIIDNDEIAMTYTTSILNRLGISSECADDSTDVIQKLTDAYDLGCGFDICFINWQMPGGYGRKITEKVREYFDHDTMLIVTASYNRIENEDDMKEAGADYILAKPVLQSKLYNLMSEICRIEDDSENKEALKYDFNGKKVLLAEDNAINAEVMIDFLKVVNLNVTWVTNGKEAVDLLEKNPEQFDLVLLDINMPVMDGYEAAKQIRSMPGKKAEELPIIAVTANAFSEDIIRAHEAGMNSHISKPIDNKLLYRTIDEYLS